MSEYAGFIYWFFLICSEFYKISLSELVWLPFHCWSKWQNCFCLPQTYYIYIYTYLETQIKTWKLGVLFSF